VSRVLFVDMILIGGFFQQKDLFDVIDQLIGPSNRLLSLPISGTSARYLGA